MIQIEIFDPFFFIQPAQDGISSVLVTTGKQGSFTVNAAATRITWLPFAGSQYELIFKGTGLGVQNGALSAGQIASIEATRILDGTQIIAVSDLDQRATDLQDQIDQAIDEQAQAGETDLWAAQFLRGLLFDPQDQTVIGSDSPNLLTGGNGNDTITGGPNDDIIETSSGADNLSGGGGTNTLRLNFPLRSGDIEYDVNIGRLQITNERDQTATEFQNVEGGDTNDTITGDDAPNILSGNAGNDTINGNGGNDTIRGGPGRDTLSGGAGDDLILGGDQFDKIRGNGGNDELFGEGNADRINGNLGNDLIVGGAGDDDLFGDAGRDNIKGGIGNDILKGGNGNDVMRGGKGSETGRFDFEPGMFGGRGHDRMFGGGNADFLSGGKGNDTMFGNSGNDFLLGNDGDDVLFGGAGKDSITAGKGNDDISGGGGRDTFFFDAKIGEGADRITDFEVDETIFVIGGDPSIVRIGVNRNGDAVVDHAGGTIDLDNIDASDLTIRLQGDTAFVEIA